MITPDISFKTSLIGMQVDDKATLAQIHSIQLSFQTQTTLQTNIQPPPPPGHPQLPFPLPKNVSAPTTKASVPVLSVGCTTGAKNGL